MERYDSYKDSGVEWIGEIPSHWRKSKFKFVSDLYTGNSLNDSQKLKYESDNPQDIPYVSSKDIDVDYQTVNYDNGLRIPKEDNPLKVSPKGSFLMVIEGGSSGRKMVFLEQDVCFVNKLCSFNSVEKTKFQYYFIQSSNYQDKFKLSLSGLIGGVSVSNLRDFELTLPPLREQERIVEYLDRKTALIDSLIEKTVRKIELLREKRTALINHVVTKGLNSDVEMKDSGVEWIGEIPRQWGVSKIKFECEIFGRIGFRGYTTEDIVDEGEGVVSISPSNIVNNEFNLKNRTYLSWDKYHESPEIQIFPGDVILVKTGSVGKTAIIPEGVSEMTLNPQLVVLKNIKPHNKYLFAQTTCRFIKESFDVEQTGSTTPTISQEKIKEFPLLLPPFHEQEQIVEYLDNQTSIIDSTIATEEKRIELLKEYRQSLISEVVTGKVKVTRDE